MLIIVTIHAFLLQISKDLMMLGAGIAAQSMTNSLKNNSRKKERTTFFSRENRLNIKKREPKKSSKEKELSTEKLSEIKKKILAQRKKEKNFNLLLFIISAVVTLFILKILFIPFEKFLT